MPTASKIVGCGLYLLATLVLALLALMSIPRSSEVASGHPISPAVAPMVTNTPVCGLAWRQVSIPLPPGNSQLNAVAGLGSADVWAVGSYGNGTFTQTLTIHWDGTQWSIVPSPNTGANSTLTSVAASGNGVWAAGYSGPAGASQTLIMRWDGTQWSIVPSPNPGTTGSNILDGIVIAGAGDAWAVGYSGSTSAYRTLTEHWDGAQWSIVPSPNDGTGNNLLHAVTATGPTDVWAVGTHYQTNISLYRTTAIHWNGSSWNPATTFPSYGDNYFFGVYALAQNDAWAVGGEEDMLDHWDGNSWNGAGGGAVVPGDLHAVSGTAHNDVWAVGDIFTSGYTPIFHFDGSLFLSYPAPTGTYLRGVAALARDSAWTVGFDGTGHALVEQYSNPCSSPTGTPTRTVTPTPTATPTSSPSPTPTFTPTPSRILVGHVTWQGIGQPSPRNNGITATLSICANGVPQAFPVSTDASGFFTVTVGLPDGTYNSLYKGSKWLATSGTITLSGGTTHQELGQQRAGDANDNNVVNTTDFTVLKNGFGGAVDLRADFDNDGAVTVADFVMLRSNFGAVGAPPNCP